MGKEETALAIIQMFLDAGVSKKGLQGEVAKLTKLAYCNPFFVDALFRAGVITKGFDIINDMK